MDMDGTDPLRILFPFNAAILDTKQLQLSFTEFQSSSSAGLASTFLSIVVAVCLGKIETSQCIAALKGIHGLKDSQEAQEYLADSLWACGTQLLNETSSKPGESNPVTPAKRLGNFVKELYNSGLINADTLRVTLELNLLMESGLINDEASSQKKLVRANTTIMYKQQKYNLLREETEGFAKLVVALAALPSPSPDDHAENYEGHVAHVLSLVGQFDLDPNRVLDIVLSAFEHQPWNTSFIEILKRFRRDNIAPMLGLKFLNYHAQIEETKDSDKIQEKKTGFPVAVGSGEPLALLSKDSKAKAVTPAPAPSPAPTSAATNGVPKDPKDLKYEPPEPQDSTPSSLYALTAVLLSHELVSLGQLIPYLRPALEEASRAALLRENSLRGDIRGFGIASLTTLSASTTATPSGDLKTGAGGLISAINSAGVEPTSVLGATLGLSVAVKVPTWGSSSTPPLPAGPRPAVPLPGYSPIAPVSLSPQHLAALRGAAPPQLHIPAGSQTSVAVAVSGSLVRAGTNQQQQPFIPPSPRGNISLSLPGSLTGGGVGRGGGMGPVADRAWDAIDLDEDDDGPEPEAAVESKVESSAPSSPRGLTLAAAAAAAAAAKAKPAPPKGAPPAPVASVKGGSAPSGTSLMPSGPSATNLVISSGPSNSSVAAYAEGNQVVGILCALLGLRCWGLASEVITLLQVWGVDPMAFADARAALLSLLLWRIHPLYVATEPSRFSLARPCSRDPAVEAALAPGEGLLCTSGREVAAQWSPGQCAQLDTLGAVATELTDPLLVLGVHLYLSPTLFTRLCRLFAAEVRILFPFCGSPRSVGHATQALCDGGEGVLPHDSVDGHVRLFAPSRAVVALVADVMLPSLTASVANPNSSLPHQIWNVISSLPFYVRYPLYEKWRGQGVGKEAIGSKHSAQVAAETVALHIVKGQMKRLSSSKESIKSLGRQIARLSQTCPIPIFNYILTQIESYDNLIPMVVDSLKQSTDLSLDVMGFLLVTQLERGGEKLREGDTVHSKWFASLARFIAMFYRRYPSVDLKGMLHYLLRKVSVGESIDLLVLKELLQHMGGSETLTEVSAEQLEGLTGGRILRTEALNSQAGGAESPARSAAKSLRQALDQSQTTIPLLIYIAQIRERVLHSEDITQLRLISHLFDTAQDVLMQFTEFLVNGSKSMNAIAKVMPPLRDLVTVSGLSLPVAFQLVRPLIRAAVQQSQQSQIKDKDEPESKLQSWHPQGANMRSFIQEHMPEHAWDHLSQDLFVAFWSLSLYDLSAPVDRYAREIKRLKERYSLMQNKQQKKEMNSLMELCVSLTEEMENHKKHVEATKKNILELRDRFFPAGRPAGEVSAALLQYCVLERVRLSPIDAVFAAQFLRLLHNIDTPNFSMLTTMDLFFKTVTPLVFCSTESEAGYLGYAIQDLLQFLNSVGRDSEQFRTNAVKQGFLVPEKLKEKPIIVGSSAAAESKDGSNEASGTDKVVAQEPMADGGVPSTDFTVAPVAMVPIQSDAYLNRLKVWHTRLQLTVMSGLRSSEYMFLRASIILLSKVSGEHPLWASAGAELQQRVAEIEAKETAREDLQLLARSLKSLLKNRERFWIQDESDSKGKGNSRAGPATDRKDKGGNSGNAKAVGDKRDRGDRDDKERERESRDGKDSRTRERERDRDCAGGGRLGVDKDKRAKREHIDGDLVSSSTALSTSLSKDKEKEKERDQRDRERDRERERERAKDDSRSRDKEKDKDKEKRPDKKAEKDTKDGKEADGRASSSGGSRDGNAKEDKDRKSLSSVTSAQSSSSTLPTNLKRSSSGSLASSVPDKEKERDDRDRDSRDRDRDRDRDRTADKKHRGSTGTVPPHGSGSAAAGATAPAHDSHGRHSTGTSAGPSSTSTTSNPPKRKHDDVAGTDRDRQDRDNRDRDRSSGASAVTSGAKSRTRASSFHDGLEEREQIRRRDELALQTSKSSIAQSTTSDRDKDGQQQQQELEGLLRKQVEATRKSQANTSNTTSGPNSKGGPAPPLAPLSQPAKSTSDSNPKVAEGPRAPVGDKEKDKEKRDSTGGSAGVKGRDGPQPRNSGEDLRPAIKQQLNSSTPTHALPRGGMSSGGGGSGGRMADLRSKTVPGTVPAFNTAMRGQHAPHMQGQSGIPPQQQGRHHGSGKGRR